MIDTTKTIADFNFSGSPNVNFTNNSTNGTSYYWNFGDGNNSNQANPSHTYTGTGNFNVTLYAYSADSCLLDSMTKVVNITSTGLNEKEINTSVRLYPNPTKDVVNINAKGINIKDLKLQLFDITGRELLTEKGILKVDLNRFPKGVYYLKLSGALEETHQIIKQ